MNRMKLFSSILITCAFIATLGLGCSRNDSGPECAGACDTGKPCGEIDADGICDGTIVRYCDDGTLYEQDCADDGSECLPPEESDVGATCIGEGESDPGDDDD